MFVWDDFLKRGTSFKTPYLDDIADNVTLANQTFCILTLKFLVMIFQSTSQEVLELYVEFAWTS